MSNKRKFDKIINKAEDAIIVDKNAPVEPQPEPLVAEPTVAAVATDSAAEPSAEPTEGGPPPTADDMEAKVRDEQFSNRINEILNKHKEKGSMAFEFLKSVIGTKLDAISNAKEFTRIVENCFTLADVFKAEMDTRWTREVMEITHAIYDMTPLHLKPNINVAEHAKSTTEAPKETVAEETVPTAPPANETIN